MPELSLFENTVIGDPVYRGLGLGGRFEGATLNKADYPGLRAIRLADGEIILASDLPDSFPIPAGSSSAAIVGEIILYAGSAAPAGWHLCDGALLSRSTYADLFAAIGTTFGAGDGSTTFGLPNLSGRFPVGAQAGGDYDRGDTGGSASVVLTEANLASHNHSYHLDRRVSATAFGGSGDLGITSATGTVSDIDPNTGSAGSGTGHENRPPFLALNFAIRIEGGVASSSAELWY